MQSANNSFLTEINTDHISLLDNSKMMPKTSTASEKLIISAQDPIMNAVKNMIPSATAMPHGDQVNPVKLGRNIVKQQKS